MTKEIEKLKAELVAAQCRIDELEIGFDDLRAWCNNEKIKISDDMWSKGYGAAFACILAEIKRITGK